MSDTYYAGCYWTARHETAEQCALRAQDFLRRLGACEPAWSRWHETASSFEKARKLQVPTEAAAFAKLFQRKKNRVGDGYSLWLWAGDQPEETTSVDAFCGASSPWSTPHSCVLKPPAQGATAERALSASVLTEVVRAMALAWEPEWGIATSEQHRDSAWQRPAVGTFTGWVMYFSRQRGTVPALPAPVRIEHLEGRGTLVILTPERFTAANPEHIALAARVHALLSEAGLLRPLRAPQGGG